MARNIKVEDLLQTPIEKQQIELVERKGIGHPDSISDGLAEAVSRALCREIHKKMWGRAPSQYRRNADCSRKVMPQFREWRSAAARIYSAGGQSHKGIRRHRTRYRICGHSGCPQVPEEYPRKHGP